MKKYFLAFFSFFSLLMLLFLSDAGKAETATPTPPPEESTQTISSAEQTALGVESPEKNSPFYIERQDAKKALATAAENPLNAIPSTPRPHSIQEMFQRIGATLQHLFGPNHHQEWQQHGVALVGSTLPEFSTEGKLTSLEATLKVTNYKKKLIMMDFPTTQRIEITIQNQEGKVIYRYSEHKHFEPSFDMVTINPQESLYFKASIPPEIIHKEDKYSITFSLVNQPYPPVTQNVF